MFLALPKELYQVNHWSKLRLSEFGLDGSALLASMLAIDVLVIFLAALIADIIARRLLLRVVGGLVKRTNVSWDDIFFEKRVFNTLAHIAPALVVRYLGPVFFSDFEWVGKLIMPITELYILFLWLFFGLRVLNAFREIMLSVPSLKDKPIDSYIQLTKVVVYIIAGLYLLSYLLGKSPLTILGAFGALTAVLLLVFKDTILGLVASITISANDLVRIGDWVSFEKYGADGDVMEITLNTVKIRNWDNTITTVPTYAFVSDAFKNWRNMEHSGARRIKRSLYIRMHSVKLCDAQMVEKYGKIELVKPFMEKRLEEIQAFNTSHQVDKSVLINGRNLTNLGLFRHYAEAYLQRHNNISKNHTLMVRQMQPTENGIPIEVYCFTNVTQWTVYEGIQADIFDHLISATRYFDLEIFESLNGHWSEKP